MTIQRKDAAAQTRAVGAKRKMTRDSILILENMAIAIDDLNCLIHLNSSVKYHLFYPRPKTVR
jgi:hypothetical protein